ncbi:hypothetical protein K458DRAFT_141068 [Lentithecium fluviatile CBS 122367]|uniref:Uncharacterized protein n=1 Tax=Lentithecium fluviatile CBS 122367 TaxID=1168545 RepID=A0A6G1IIZ3_9PLEO|nr:hypothetical protein K458DRAFT_141068 [Lentithecium fluviatile CBS 122367]
MLACPDGNACLWAPAAAQWRATFSLDGASQEPDRVSSARRIFISCGGVNVKLLFARHAVVLQSAVDTSILYAVPLSRPAISSPSARLDASGLHDLIARSSGVEICCACQQLTCAILARNFTNEANDLSDPVRRTDQTTTTSRHLWRGQRIHCRNYTYTYTALRAVADTRQGPSSLKQDRRIFWHSTTTTRSFSTYKTMPPDSSCFTALNCPNDAALPEFMGLFSLAAPPNTDLWRKPPSRDTSTAPILYTALRNPFIAAEVTVSADWELEWDQGGLVIFSGAPPGRAAVATTITPEPANEGTSTSTSTPTSTTQTLPTGPSNSAAISTNPSAPAAQTPNMQSAGQQPNSVTQTQRQREAPPPYMAPAPASKWVKVGLEFCNGACHATSVVATSDGADWALTALPPHHARRSDLRVKIERIGYALWVWYEDEVSGWKKLREVTWFFWGVEDKAVRVGVYASRPANFGSSMYERRHGGGHPTPRNLCVDFEGLEIF